MIRPDISSGERPAYCQATPITGTPMLGKMSVGVLSAASGPTIRISNASTTKVYGRCKATRTIQSIRTPSPGGREAFGLKVFLGQHEKPRAQVLPGGLGGNG